MAGVQDPEHADHQGGEGRDRPEPRAQRPGQHFKREPGGADFQVRSGQAIQREPPVVSDAPSSDLTALRTPAPGPYDSAGAVSRCDPELIGLSSYR
ncbi:hypothetical protein GCM10022420_038460 [Streptomyces iranensis]